MTAGELFKEEIITNQFGKTRVAETATMIKKVWPDGFPEGRNPVNHYHVAYFLYILSSSEGPKDVALALARSIDFKNKEKGGLIVTEIGKILSNENNISLNDCIHISVRTGFVDIYTKSERYPYPEDKERIDIVYPPLLEKWEDELRVIQRELIKESPDVTKKLLRSEEKALSDRINAAKSAHEKWKKKLGTASDDQVDFVTILKGPFLKALAKRLKE